MWSLKDDTKYGVVQAIHISLFMGVNKNYRYPASNSYKQCVESSQQSRDCSSVQDHS